MTKKCAACSPNGVSTLGLKWSIKALIDLDEAQAYIAHENPGAAVTIAKRIKDAERCCKAIRASAQRRMCRMRVSGSCGARRI